MLEDLLDENDESFSLVLSNINNATFANGGTTASTSIEITDNDFAPSLSVVGSQSVTEGQAADIVVSLTAPSSQNIEVGYELGMDH